MEKLLIIGAGGLGRMTLEVASLYYDCYFVDDAYENDNIICGVKVVGKIDDLPYLISFVDNAIIAIGNNLIRSQIFARLKKIGFNIPNIISPQAYVSKFSNIGMGCIILPFACIHNGATLGNSVVITSLVEVHHDCIIEDYSLIYSNSTIRTHAFIGKKAKIGSNVSIGNNVKILDSSIVCDGSCIIK